MRPLNFVFLPGLYGTGSLFKFILPYFAEHATQVIAYPNEGEQDYETLAAYVRGVVSFDKFHLVAESFSGPVALMVGANSPERVRGISLSATFVENPINRFLLPPFLALPKISIGRRALAYVLDTDDEETIVETLRVVNDIPRELLRRRLKAIVKLDSHSLDYSGPLQYLQAKKDYLVRPSAVQKVRAKFPRAEIETLDAGGHFLLQSHPRICAEKIIEFAHKD